MSPIEYLRARYAQQPHEVSIETLALCNAACTFCPYPTLARKGTLLSTVVIYDLLEQMKSWSEPFFISPFKVNEPLLDSRLQEICERIESTIPRARLRLFTNGQPLTERHLEWISRLNRLEHLWVSLNSTDPQEYGELMKCSFSMVADKLDELHRRVVAGSFKHPVVLSRVMQGDERQLSPQDYSFHRSALARWPHFQVRLIKRDSWLGYVDPSSSAVPQAPCSRWWELNITAEGKAVLCCMDGKGEYVMGDVREQSLLEIYNSSPLSQHRRSHTRYGVPPCERCSY